MLYYNDIAFGSNAAIRMMKQLEAENKVLKECVESAMKLQKVHFGNGTMTHIGLQEWSELTRQSLAKLNLTDSQT